MSPSTSAARVYLSKWPQSGNTYGTMRQALGCVVTALGDDRDPMDFPWHELRYERACGIAAALANRGLAPATINKCLAAARGVIETAWRIGMMTDDEYRRIAIENVAGNSERAGRALEARETDALYAALRCTTPHDAAVLAVLAGAGIRRIELVRLRVSDYVVATGRLTVKGKRNKRREIPVGERWLTFLDAWARSRKGEALMFDFGAADGRRAVSYIVKCTCERYALRRFTPHDLRRTFGTHVERVAGIAVAQKLLGHESIRTTSLYVRVDAEREAAAVKNL